MAEAKAWQANDARSGILGPDAGLITIDAILKQGKG
jgi:hypothetical protein